MVFYLKYRPKNLSELDNREVAELMVRYLHQDSIPHAFLFAGPRGTGKTSTARIIAKCINCKSTKDKSVPCNKCDICLSITQGSHLDILEIDAASNRGIDEIRELREKIKLSPTQLTYKVYIIDEVHMLTTEAFNALLKTLEEPPLHAIFILATTEIQKVPETIISRCIKINFRRANDGEIIHSLKRITRGEKIDIDDDALAEIGQMADGSFRDAAKILEEIAMEKSKITLKTVIQKLGITDKALENTFIQALKIKDTKTCLEVIQNLSTEGKNIRLFFLKILNLLKDTLIKLYLEKTPQDWEKTYLLDALNIFSQAFVNLKTAVIPSLPFEIAIVEYCEKEKLTSLPQSIQVTSVAQMQNSAKSLVPNNAISSKWEQILLALKPYNHSIVGVLRSCKPIAYDGKELTLEAAYKFHAERISEPKTLELIAKVIKDIIGQNIKINTVIKKR